MCGGTFIGIFYTLNILKMDRENEIESERDKKKGRDKHNKTFIVA